MYIGVEVLLLQLAGGFDIAREVQTRETLATSV
jgi:hypothetical protein